MYKLILKKLIPGGIIFLLRALPNYYYDLKLFYKHSAVRDLNSEIKLISMIVRDYHIIEKGLTMPETRLGFGRDVLLNLITNCTKYINLYGTNCEQLRHALEVVSEYENFHKSEDFNLDQDVKAKVANVIKLAKISAPCIQRTTTKNLYFSKATDAFPTFSCSRSSVRNYSDLELSVDLIKQSIDIARNTPSVCNRQAARVYIFTKREKIKEILAIQGGNRGFGHLADKLIVITAELGVFISLGERNQAYIDGGMFAMNLLYTLHYNKIAACILNCSHSATKDKIMRKVCPIKETEVFIAMITCGNAPDNFQIAASPRNSIEKYLTVID